MRQIFISYVEEDAPIARDIAGGLESAGYSAWYYERDTVPGVPYLIQVGQAIEGCQAIVLIITPRSLGSNQVTNEVVRAYESGKHFIPLLYQVSDAELKERQAIWRQCLGASTSITIPREGISAILLRIIDGLKALDVQPGGGRRAPTLAPDFSARPRPFLQRALLWIIPAVLLVVGVVIAIVVITDDGGAPPDDTNGNSSTPGYKTYSDYGFSVEYPDDMDISVVGLDDPQPNNDSGMLMCINGDETEGLIAAWANVEADVVVTTEDLEFGLDSAFGGMEAEPGTTVDDRGPYQYDTKSGHQIVYQTFTVTEAGETYSGIWGMWYCDNAERLYQLALMGTNGVSQKSYDRCLDSFICHDDTNGPSGYKTYSDYGFSIQYPDDMIISVVGLDDPQPNNDSGKLMGISGDGTEVIVAVWANAVVTPTTEDLKFTLDSEFGLMEAEPGTTVDDRGPYQYGTKSGHQIVYQTFTMTVDGDTAFGIYGIWYCDNAERLYELVLMDAEGVNQTSYDRCLDYFICHST